MIKVHVVTIGASPLLAGDAESALAVHALDAAGIPVAARASVEEDEAALESVLAPDGGVTIVVAAPGGPAGDVVRRVIARATGARLSLNDRMLGALEERHRRRDRPLPRRDERLALLPQGAVVWTTPDDDPAWMLDHARGVFVVLPRGARLDRLVTEHLAPLLATRHAGRGAIVTRTLKTAGVTATDVEERVTPWLAKDGDVAVVVTPVDADVWVRLRARGATAADAGASLAPIESEIRAVLGKDCYGHDAESLEQVVGRLLIGQAATLSVAESCTGGLLAQRLTSLPDSSSYFERGVVLNSDAAKIDLLAVPEEVLRTHGEVSAPTAEAMARGICQWSGSPCGLSVTGFVGPDGGTRAKPVGTVFVGIAVRDTVSARRFLLLGDRASIRWQASQMALEMLRRKLGGE